MRKLNSTHLSNRLLRFIDRKGDVMDIEGLCKYIAIYENIRCKRMGECEGLWLNIEERDGLDNVISTLIHRLYMAVMEEHGYTYDVNSIMYGDLFPAWTKTSGQHSTAEKK